MLVWCPKCGTSYDLEKRGSICPGGGYDRNELGKTISEKKKKNRKEFWKFTKAQKTGCVIILCLMILLTGIMFLVKTSIINRYIEQNGVGILEQQSASMRENISVDGGSVYLSDCKIMNEWDDKIPDGCSIIFVPFTSEGDVTYHTTLYLKFDAGEYVAPLDAGYLSDMLGKSYEEISETYGVKESLFWSNGNMAFLVPNNVSEATLVLYSMKESSNIASTVDKIYQIPVNWEVQ